MKRPLFSKLAVVTLLCVFAVVLFSFSAMSQSAGTGALKGFVKDPTGAVIGKAEVTLTNLATAQSRTASANADGSYSFLLLPPGKYRVKVSATGFKSSEFPSITINVTETATLDCLLQVGAPNDTFTVEAGSETLQLTTSTMGTLVTGDEITTLPLTSRNYTQILDFSSGASASVHDATALGKGTADMSVNGSNPSQNNFQMDGVAINSFAGLGTANDTNVGAGIGIPNPDAIQEFKVQTSTFDASYGRNPGGNVNVITKSGSNAIHGSAFEFLRNTALNANPFFFNRDNQDRSVKKPVLNQNQYGFAVGGPVKKDKLFLFGSYQGSRQKNGISGKGSLSVEAPPIPNGDRSAPGFAAALGAAMCTGWSLGPNVACDGSNISPVALNILRLKLSNGNYYVPGSGTAGNRTIFYSDPARYEGEQFLVNSDLYITPKQTLATRFFYTRDPQYAALGGMPPGNPQKDFYSNHNASVKLTSFISNTFTNEARFSLQRNWGDITDETLKGASTQELGINHIVQDQTKPPWFMIAGSMSLFNDFRPAQSLASHYQYADQIAWVHGKHTVRAGMELERVHYFSNPGFSRGFFIFLSWNDFIVGGPYNIFYSMMEKGDGPQGGISHAYRQSNLSGFAQDDWKVSSRLTVNLGLRWEYNGMLSDNLGNLTNIWPSLLASVPTPPTAPTTSGAGLVGYVVPKNHSTKYGPVPEGVKQVDNKNSIARRPPLSNFAPRIGFAWQPTGTGKFVVRGGFGLFYDRVWADAFVHALQQSPPYAVSLNYSYPNTYTLANPFRTDMQIGTFPSRWSNLACDPDGTNCTGGGSALNVNFLPPYIHTPLTRQYNLGIQYEFLPNWVLEVGYVGSSGINLMDVYHNKNTARLASPEHPIRGQIANTKANVGLRVPYLGFEPSGLQGTEFDGTSNYSSLQLTLRKQFSYGLSLQGSYTWSKNLSDIAVGGPYYGRSSNDPDNPRQQYGRTAFSRPQRFIFNYTYDLPLGSYAGWKGKLLQGWSLAGITTVQSGTPLTFTDTNAGSIYGNTGTMTIAPRANMCSGASHGSILTKGDIRNRLNSYINTAAFCDAPAIGDGTGYGNSGVGVVLGPGQFNWDITLIKQTKIKERHMIQFRTEFYNAFNTPQFANPGTARSTPSTFGRITATSVNPRIIQFGLKYSF